MTRMIRWFDLRIGQIYKEKDNNIFVITSIKNNFVSIIEVGGYANTFSLDILKRPMYILWILIAEYPTWQEAVNSKEFKE